MAKHPLNQSGLFKLIQEAQQYQALKEHVLNLLPDNMRHHVCAVGIEHPYLVLVINEALWASKIRFLAPACLDQINETYPGLNLVNPVRIRLNNQPHNIATQAKTTRPAMPPDQETAKKMLALSEQVTSSKLALALKKLSDRAQ
ncbi:DciA family protein [Thiomicrospira cyclica]|uniref:DUF721 domain-containing protein n=1 Tax=Thiomicrospira cyclica (strain DSM 14477 / JCM 11371 / ALM1) TaxID=717773 RepID=F6D9M3_THICA|nr:DciA family protein [Thiomicrospira cyclica]AEG30980.1 hypothetical protein Thicy_0204 [Thiomicrospira cyclica ALM1]